MSYQTYITKAIVCGSRHSMTSDKSYLLYTQELGMLWATARSVRMEKSKQRPALQDFSVIRVSLVRGKATWRIGSVEALANPFLASQTRVARGAVSYIVKALRKYVHGEVPVPRAFQDVLYLLPVVSKETDIDMIALYQNVFMIRLLDELGYVKITDAIMALIQREDIQSACEAYDDSMDAAITACITHAAEVSHL